MSTVTALAAVVPLVWLGWLVLTDWVPMYPLNDLEHRDHHQRAVGAATTYSVGLLVSAGVLIGQRWSLATAVIRVVPAVDWASMAQPPKLLTCRAETVTA